MCNFFKGIGDGKVTFEQNFMYAGFLSNYFNSFPANLKKEIGFLLFECQLNAFRQCRIWVLLVVEKVSYVPFFHLVLC